MKTLARIQKGFSLVELMIVVAIVGILASFAVPYYGDYVAHSRLAGSLSVAQGMKVYVADCFLRTGDLNTCDADTNGIPTNIATGQVTHVETLVVENGVITLTSTAELSSGGNMEIVITPDTSVGSALQWNMTGSGCEDDGGTYNPRGINCTN